MALGDAIFAHHMPDVDGNLGLFSVGFRLWSIRLCTSAVCVAHVWLESNASRWFFRCFSRSFCTVAINWKNYPTIWRLKSATAGYVGTGVALGCLSFVDRDGVLYQTFLVMLLVVAGTFNLFSEI